MSGFWKNRCAARAWLIIGLAVAPAKCELTGSCDINSDFRFFCMMEVKAPDSAFKSPWFSDSLTHEMSGDPLPVTEMFSLSLSRSSSFDVEISVIFKIPSLSSQTPPSSSAPFGLLLLPFVGNFVWPAMELSGEENRERNLSSLH